MTSAINKKDKSGHTPLIKACKLGHENVVESLLAHKDIDINLGDNDGMTALHLSAVVGNVDIVNLLIDKGANVNALDKEGESPLNMACHFHQHIAGSVADFSEVNFCLGVKSLLERGADVNLASANGWSPAHNICGYSGSVDLLQLLIRHGADMSAKKTIGQTPLMIACTRAFSPLIVAMANANIDLDTRGAKQETALWLASCSDERSCVIELIKAKCDLNAKCIDGSTSLWIAAYRGHSKIVEFLTQAGANVNLPDDDGHTPLWAASQHGHVSCMAVMLKGGADVSIATKNGTTPLMIACQENKLEVVKILIKYNANLNTKSKSGNSAIGVLSYKGFTSCLKLMIEAGADINGQDGDGDTPLHLAVYHDHPKCIELLLKAGANQELEEKNGLTPLHFAIHKNHARCVQTLLGEGESVLAHAPVKGTATRAEKGKTEYRGMEHMIRAMTDLLVVRDPKPNQVDGIMVKENESSKRKVHVIDIANAFLKDLNVSGAYFNPSFNVCFCDKCHTSRNDKPKYTRGKPPKDYGLPIGWCKFGLKLKPQAEAENIFQDWHVAFHGTRVPNLAKILKNGDLLKPGDVTYDGEELTIPPNHWDPNNPDMKPPSGHDVRKLYFSPSIKYSGCNVYAPIWCWIDPSNGETYNIRAAFQVRIKPGSYDVTAQTIGATSDIDPLFPNSELEWSTRRFGVTMLVGLLIKVEDADAASEGLELHTDHTQPAGLQATGFNDTRPVLLIHDYTYKTRRGRSIQLKAGEDCLLISKTATECVIMHPKVDGNVVLPSSFIAL